MICDLARLNGLQWKVFVAGRKKGMVEISPGVKYDRLCRHCFAPIYRGSNHTDNACKSRRQALSNVTAAVDNGNTSMDLVASKYLKTLSSEVQSSTVGLKQSSGGRSPLLVTLGKCSGDGDKPLPISTMEVKSTQTEAGLSDKQVCKVLKNLRLKFGRKIVEPRIREALVAEKTMFDKFFTADLLQFQDSDGSLMLKPAVYCSNIVDFVSELMQQRGLDPGDVKLKIGLDKGEAT